MVNSIISDATCQDYIRVVYVMLRSAQSIKTKESMREIKPWTTTLVVTVSIIATSIGVYNPELFLNTVCLINTMPAISKHCKQLL